MFIDDLTEKEIGALEKTGAVRVYDKGAYIIREGTPGTSLSLILSGRVEVRKKLSGTHSKAVAVLGACDMVGDLGFFGVEARSADVITLEPSQLLEFDRTAIDKLADSNPKIGVKIYRNMAGILALRLANANAELKDAIVWMIAKEIDRLHFPDIRQHHELRLKRD